MANSKPVTKVNAQAIIDLNADQAKKIEAIIEEWQWTGGVVMGSLAERSGEFSVGFRLLPAALAQRVSNTINDYFKEN